MTLRIAAAKAESCASAQDGAVPELTERQRDLLQHVARGLSDKEIARDSS